MSDTAHRICEEHRSALADRLQSANMHIAALRTKTETLENLFIELAETEHDQQLVSGTHPNLTCDICGTAWPCRNKRGWTMFRALYGTPTPQWKPAPPTKNSRRDSQPPNLYGVPN